MIYLRDLVKYVLNDFLFPLEININFDLIFNFCVAEISYILILQQLFQLFF